MPTNIYDLEKTVNSGLTTAVKISKVNFNQLYIDIEIENLISSILFLKTNEKCKFKQLIDITAVDYPEKEKRFKIVYLLLSLELNLRILINSYINEKDDVPSLTKIFSSANWMEREVFDMYGVSFKDHPDLRRILTDYDFEGHPLRKDFPLTGHTEVRYSEEKKKVVYEPVKLNQEYRNFDSESPWDGTKYIKQQEKKKETKDK
jgi:NADH-quinone oxidoreductase subunit C